jgi:hypothetical protein
MGRREIRILGNKAMSVVAIVVGSSDKETAAHHHPKEVACSLLSVALSLSLLQDSSSSSISNLVLDVLNPREAIHGDRAPFADFHNLLQQRCAVSALFSGRGE